MNYLKYTTKSRELYTNNHILSTLSHILILNSGLIYVSMWPYFLKDKTINLSPSLPLSSQRYHCLHDDNSDDDDDNDGNKNSKFTVCWPLF